MSEYPMSASHYHMNRLAEKDAEIERLKAELDLSENAGCDQIAYSHGLRRKLSAWINKRKSKIHPTDPIHTVLEEAREATKHE